MARYTPPLRRAVKRATGFKQLRAEWERRKVVHGPRSKATENAWKAMLAYTTNQLKGCQS